MAQKSVAKLLDAFVHVDSEKALLCRSGGKWLVLVGYLLLINYPSFSVGVDEDM